MKTQLKIVHSNKAPSSPVDADYALVQITSDVRSDGGLVIGHCMGHRFNAKVADKGSLSGIDNGRVVKLSISNGMDHFGGACFSFGAAVFYDRAPAGLVDTIVAALETLPAVK